MGTWHGGLGGGGGLDLQIRRGQPEGHGPAHSAAPISNGTRPVMNIPCAMVSQCQKRVSPATFFLAFSCETFQKVNNPEKKAQAVYLFVPFNLLKR